MDTLTYDKLLSAVIVIVLLLGAYNTIMTSIKNHREEKKLRNSPIANLESQIKKHDELLKNDKERLDDFDKQVTNLDTKTTIMLKGVRSLLSHEVNGNSIDKLNASLGEIDEYLITRK